MKFSFQSSRHGYSWLYFFASKIVILFLVIGVCAGCARSPDDSYSGIALTGDLSAPFQVKIDNFVRRQAPVAYVQPSGPLGYKPTALFVPLRMMQQMNNAVTFSDMLTRQIWQVWLSLGAFSTLEYAPQAGPFERSNALALAKQKGAQILIGGYINHYMDGGSGGESSLSLVIEAYDVNTGNMIWQIAQGGLMDRETKHDFYLFTITERNPADPSGLIIRSLAWDMGNVVKKWVDPYAGNNKSSTSDKMTGNKAF